MKFSLDAEGYEKFKKLKLTKNQIRHTRLDKKYFWRYNNYLKKEYNFTREENEGYSYVYKQPENEEEEEMCQNALDGCPVEAIGND